jgi:hypothetical protein
MPAAAHAIEPRIRMLEEPQHMIERTVLQRQHDDVLNLNHNSLHLRFIHTPATTRRTSNAR